MPRPRFFAMKRPLPSFKKSKAEKIKSWKFPNFLEIFKNFKKISKKQQLFIHFQRIYICNEKFKRLRTNTNKAFPPFFPFLC